jgi:hypothetical protein
MESREFVVETIAVRTFCITLMTFFAAAPTSSEQPSERWLLMSRHGDCAEIETLKRKIPQMPNVQDPSAFTTAMRNRGYSVSTVANPALNGQAVQIDVAELSLNLIFVKEALCDDIVSHEY